LAKHDKTLEAIFAKPTRSNVKWGDAISLFRHLGADITEAEGSRVAVALNDVRAVFHKPHPKPDIKKYALEDMRSFLEEAGEAP
jgi:hypothetical protein